MLQGFGEGEPRMEETFTDNQGSTPDHSREQDSDNKQDANENHASFLERLEGESTEVLQSVDFSYALGKEAHRPQRRETGERYFEHVRNVALILIDECKVKDPDVISAALLHDAVEDSAMFGNVLQPYSQWKETTRFRISKAFNPRVAEIVIALTKPRVDGKEITSKRQAHEVYIENLKSAPPEAMLVKMSDRLHNLRTLAGTKPEKQDRILTETEQEYFPMFDEAVSDYPEESDYLRGAMRQEVEKLRKVPTA